MSTSEYATFELFRLFELTPDLVCIAGKDGYFKHVNQAVVDKLGYTKEELFAHPIHTFIYPADKELTRRRRVELLEGKALINFDNRYVAKNGAIIWLHWTSIYIPDREVVFAIAKDITERKQREQEIEEKYKTFKSLAHHFKTRLETDKKTLATELHEELAQLALVAKMDISWLEEANPALDEPSKNRLGHARSVLDLLIHTIRKISYSISPNMLDDVGLNETLKWLCEEFSILTKIPCHFHSDCNEGHIQHELQLDLFRICQEALTIIRTTMKADTVTITLQPCRKKICLTLQAACRNLDLLQLNQSPWLDNLRKRAASANGKLTINDAEGDAFSLCIELTPSFTVSL